jgi:hypothetical protein
MGTSIRALACATTVATMLVTALASPITASAITPNQVISRARTWVSKRVPYSQRRHYRGYRQDCSGFVSMAWHLGRSYTTRSISHRAYRIPISALRPGDAVWRRGHVAIFGGWKNKAKRTYWAYEETTWGSHAKRHVRKIPRHARALRRRGLSTVPIVLVASVPATESVDPTNPPASVVMAATAASQK